MWARVRDAVAVLVGGNAGEIAFTVVGTALGGRSPLGTRQLLLVNLLTDMFPALAVAVAAPRAVRRDGRRDGIEPGRPARRASARRGAARRPAPRLHGRGPAAGPGPRRGHGGRCDRGVGDRPAHRVAQPRGIHGPGRADRHAARADGVDGAAQPAGAGHRRRVVRRARRRGADPGREPVLRLPAARTRSPGRRCSAGRSRARPGPSWCRWLVRRIPAAEPVDGGPRAEEPSPDLEPFPVDDDQPTSEESAARDPLRTS